MNILFTCAGRRNYLINYFKKALKDKGMVFAADMQKSAPALVDADHSIIVPSIYEKNYIDTIIHECEINKISVIFSLNDLELPILSENIKLFQSKGINVIISDKNVIDICFDKWKTMNFINNIGLKSPRTYIDYDNALDDIKKGILNFPLIIKPRWGSASIGIEVANNLEELSLIYSLSKIKIENSILHEASKEEIDQSVLIQEYITGVEYGIDVINNLKGEYCTTIVKRKLAMRAGETDKAVVVDDENIKEIGKIIGTSLKHIGNLDCDIFYNGKNYFVLEMNPRFGGGFPFSYEAGVDLPLVIIKWLNNEPVDLNLLIPKTNIAFAKCDRLIKITSV
jgi:carbamoyl-phosphate synthase large subunit